MTLFHHSVDSIFLCAKHYSLAIIAEVASDLLDDLLEAHSNRSDSRTTELDQYSLSILVSLLNSSWGIVFFLFEPSSIT